jgi:hypothetical protein
MNGRAVGSSVVGSAITQAAVAMGMSDPMAIADELLAIDVDGLREWCAVAAHTQARLRQGIERLSDALPLLAGG